MVVILRIDAASVGRPFDRVDAIVPIGGQAALARAVAVHNVELVILIGAQFIVETEPESEEHTSELQSLMRISYAVFCLKKKKKQTTNNTRNNITQSNQKTRIIKITSK